MHAGSEGPRRIFNTACDATPSVHWYAFCQWRTTRTLFIAFKCGLPPRQPARLQATVTVTLPLAVTSPKQGPGSLLVLAAGAQDLSSDS